MRVTPNQTVFYFIEKSIKEYRRFAQRNIQQLNTKITVDQTLLLMLIDKHPELSQNEIGDIIFKDNASVTRMVELLVNGNYLKRSVNPEDRRKYDISLTYEGKNILQKLTKIVDKNRSLALKGISKSEIEQLIKTLTKIIDNCNSN